MKQRFKVGDKVKLKYKNWNESLSYRESGLETLTGTVEEIYPSFKQFYFRFGGPIWWYPMEDYILQNETPFAALKRSIEAEV